MTGGKSLRDLLFPQSGGVAIFIDGRRVRGGCRHSKITEPGWHTVTICVGHDAGK